MKIGMFTGLETYGKDLNTLVGIGRDIKARGADTWLFKVGDGINLWYTTDFIKTLQNQSDIPIYPYFYSEAGNIEREKQIVTALVQAGFNVIIDAEDQYFEGTFNWKDIHVFGVTSYANPKDSSKGNLWANLNNFNTDYFLPQVYYTYDAQVWRQQYQGYNCIPVYQVGTLANASGEVAIALWEYQSWSAENVAQVASLLSISEEQAIHMEQQFSDMWKAAGVTTGTGIYTTVLDKAKSGVFLGYPISHEWATVDWSGNEITRQDFANGWIEWQTKTGENHGYTADANAKIVPLW